MLEPLVEKVAMVLDPKVFDGTPDAANPREWRLRRDKARAQARAAIAAMATGDWRVVAAEPDETMLRAYKGALKKYIDALPDDVRLPGKRGLIITDNIKAAVRYRAMLSASPTPEATDVER